MRPRPVQTAGEGCVSLRSVVPAAAAAVATAAPAADSTGEEGRP